MTKYVDQRSYRRVSLRFYLIANHFSRCLRNYYDERFELSINAWRIMSHLAHNAPASAKQVARQNGMDRVCVTRTVDQLVAQGFVWRGGDATDRRRISLELTAAGRAVYEAVVPVAHGIERAMLTDVSDEELAGFERVLDKIDQRCREIFDEEHSVRDFLPMVGERRSFSAP